MKNLLAKKKNKSANLFFRLIAMFLFIGLILTMVQVIKRFEQGKFKTNKITTSQDLISRGKLIINETGEILGDEMKKSQEIIGEQIGDLLQNVASQSVEKANNLFFDKTIGEVVHQFDKLPDKQKQEIKKAICQ
ncbi:hypothetical protein COS31_03040 [Candidatus Roizmanbacteria bacterium CG02_land_8_20_14_3_00_36_15]|uniref:Uncharacterized protein n=2 Tax=Candidatus Roizmaniibacteriota TaxID=1752723 RepID=A0A2M8KKZ0_9BACT|nr:MAG: hypothetical protein COS31_03040 [Candidatus Roizmanbacteria bacterium CG02_land_8_20_14_3_00_36_15]PJA52763.1 MAG: hypothetical protein CO166_04385 [Candidatus Roizmanbacteria bacterium CG_4_9_14_3_um_filter_36_11]PJC81195.1 MAG: hypothetical protein CO007_05925 [Candidatus Roizmanbacteria bacterium CG_4_8_14_3_um_filter_36_10]PJE60585.1 MAG: hypothetical protein COU86_03495 [Candidatus Roizmanbacteria bacterium CG10_big_fil_rev_8_21_14_0_10_36_26]